MLEALWKQLPETPQRKAGLRAWLRGERQPSADWGGGCRLRCVSNVHLWVRLWHTAHRPITRTIISWMKCCRPQILSVEAKALHSRSPSQLVVRLPICCSRSWSGRIRAPFPHMCIAALQMLALPGSEENRRQGEGAGGGWVHRKMLSGSGLFANCNLCKRGARLITAAPFLQFILLICCCHVWIYSSDACLETRTLLEKRRFLRVWNHF